MNFVEQTGCLSNMTSCHLCYCVVLIVMANRFFEGSKHAALYVKFRPVTPAEVITKIITYVKEKISSPLYHAVDAGCGSGQSTAALAPYFQKVTGIDISDAQISEARENNTLSNVEYKTWQVEKMPLDNGSLQLVTASQSAHWFNLPEFYLEVDRLLVPFGVLALYGYSIPLPIHPVESITKNAKEVITKYYEEDVGKYFPPQRLIVDNCYKDITLPYNDNVRTSVISHMHCTLSDYYGYLKTWSGYQKLKAEDPEKAKFLMNRVCERLRDALEAPSVETPLTIAIQYFILMGRKPKMEQKLKFTGSDIFY